MTEPAAPADGTRARRIWRRVGFALLGIFLYTVCINMYSGYPGIGSEWINRAAIAAIVVFALVVFVRDERRAAEQRSEEERSEEEKQEESAELAAHDAPQRSE